MSKSAFDSQQYTKLLHFVVIYSDPEKISHLDSLKGMHIHTIKNSLIGQDAQSEIEVSPSFPSHTVIAHGTLYDLADGRFDSGITEKIRREQLGGDIGIASHSIPIDGTMTLNDEAIIVGGRAYLGAYDGSGRSLTDDDSFAFLQLVSLHDAADLEIDSVENTEDLIEKIQQGLPHGSTSFAAYFTGYLPEHATSRTIRGIDPAGRRYTNLKEAWGGWRVYRAKEQPELSHQIQINGLRIASPVKVVTINHFLVADSKGPTAINGRHYREADDPLREDKAARVIQEAYRKYRFMRNETSALTR